MSSEEQIREASDRFYDAVNSMLGGDPDPMRAVWSHGDDVTYMGPFGSTKVGWAEVEDTWEHQARMHLGGRVEPVDLHVTVLGDVAYTMCVEKGEELNPDGGTVQVDHRATNIYRREDGEWKMVHHHTDLSPQLQEGRGR
jgi:ketosteroid isomerase-like protein